MMLPLSGVLLNNTEWYTKTFTQKATKYEQAFATDHINPFMPSGIFYLRSLDRSISNMRGVWLVFIITMF